MTGGRRREKRSVMSLPRSHLIANDMPGKAGARYASAKQTRRHGDPEPTAGRPAGSRVRGEATVRGGCVRTGRGPYTSKARNAARRSGGRR
jgi:hypothetical protein